MRYLRSVFLCLWAFFPAFILNADPPVFHVSPKGSDKSPGTASQPWKTLDHAFARLAEESGDVRLVVGEGEYQISSRLILDGIRGWSVVVEAAPGTNPVLRGDRRLGRFRPVKDKSVLSKLVPEVRGKVLETSLKAAGINDYGQACVKAELTDLYWKGERQRIAAYPDDKFLITMEALGPTVLDDGGRKEGIFTYSDEWLGNLAEEKDPWIYAYFRWDWKDDYQKVASIDPASKQITLEAPWHHYGYRDGFKFRAVNILQGLDSPGEYYIDRDNGTLYWYPPREYASGDEVTLSVLGSEFMLEVADCENITIKGLTFVGGRRSALGVSGSENVTIEGVKAFRFGSDALHADSSKDLRVEGCHFATLGHSGMRIFGGDRRTLTSSGYVVSNTVVENISLFQHTYEPAVWFNGCGLLISHCDFSVCPSSAVNLGGNDIILEYNYFHNLVQESDDQGGLDMFYNYSYRGMIVRYNLWENIRGGSLHGAAGVRFDDMISGQKVYGNIFKNVGGVHFGGVQIHGGKDNVVDNNVFYNCNIGVSFSPWGKDRWEEALTRPEVVQRLYEDVDINGELFRSRYPGLAESIHSDVDRNIIVNNLMVGCRRMFYDDKGQNYLKNNHGISIGENPVTESLEYYLNPEVLAGFGLQPIPYKEIGTEAFKPLL